MNLVFSQEQTVISYTTTGLQISLCTSALAMTFNEHMAFLPLSCGGMARLDRIACCRKSILSLAHGVLDRTRNLTNQLCG